MRINYVKACFVRELLQRHFGTLPFLKFFCLEDISLFLGPPIPFLLTSADLISCLLNGIWSVLHMKYRICTDSKLMQNSACLRNDDVIRCHLIDVFPRCWLLYFELLYTSSPQIHRNIKWTTVHGQRNSSDCKLKGGENNRICLFFSEWRHFHLIERFRRIGQNHWCMK